MPHKLVNRSMQIPNGYTYLQPETKWRPTRYSSFTFLVAQVINHRLGNTVLAEKYPTSLEEVSEEIDVYNAEICARNGWTKYIRWEENWTPPPKLAAMMEADKEKQSALGSPSGVFRAAIRSYTGVVTLADWLGSDGKAVPPEQSEARALVCATCPQNQSGDLTSFFTKPVADLLRRQIEQRTSMKLATPEDDRLGVCAACGCPLKLKVHVPLKFIKQHMREPEKHSLDKRCWILSETEP